MNAKDKIKKRLDSYWKLELMNVIVLPAVMVLWPLSYGYRIGWGSYFSMIPMCGLLYIGGIYWRSKRQALDVGIAPVQLVMPRISKAQYPLMLLSIIAITIAILLWVRPDLSASRGDQWTATTAAALAGLEYINYYHRQLQHFDHGPDFKRLLAGQGFRRSQLAKDLKNWKQGKL